MNPQWSFSLVWLAVIVAGCDRSDSIPPAPLHAAEKSASAPVESKFYVGEALVGDSNELAHINVLIGDKSGPAGEAFANAFANQKEGHVGLHVVLEPNLAVKPATIAVPQVTIKSMDQSVRFFGAAQSAIAKAIADSVKEGVISKSQTEKLVVICTVFIHPSAKDDQVLFKNNYEAMKLAVKRALNSQPSADEMLDKRSSSP